MQTRGVFPELNAGRKQSRKNGRYSPADKGITGFRVGRAPKSPNNPRTLAGRRAAAHSRYGS